MAWNLYHFVEFKCMLSLDRDNQKDKDKGDASGKGKPYGSYMAAKGSSMRTVAAKALYS